MLAALCVLIISSSICLLLIFTLSFNLYVRFLIPDILWLLELVSLTWLLERDEEPASPEYCAYEDPLLYASKITFDELLPPLDLK